MPGSGKSTVAACLAEALDRIALDSDAEIEEKNGATCAQLIEKHGEAEFRKLESEAIAELGKRSGAVIATGGGCVTREENYDLLHQNGIIFWLERDVSTSCRARGDLFPRATLRRCTTGARPATKDLPTTSSTTTAQWKIPCRQFWIA